MDTKKSPQLESWGQNGWPVPQPSDQANPTEPLYHTSRKKGHSSTNPEQDALDECCRLLFQITYHPHPKLRWQRLRAIEFAINVLQAISDEAVNLVSADLVWELYRLKMTGRHDQAQELATDIKARTLLAQALGPEWVFGEVGS